MTLGIEREDKRVYGGVILGSWGSGRRTKEEKIKEFERYLEREMYGVYRIPSLSEDIPPVDSQGNSCEKPRCMRWKCQKGKTISGIDELE